MEKKLTDIQINEISSYVQIKDILDYAIKTWKDYCTFVMNDDEDKKGNRLYAVHVFSKMKGRDLIRVDKYE